MPASIATRLFLSFLAVVVVGLAAAAITIPGLLLRYENDQTKLRLEELSAPFLTAIQTGVRAGQQPREIVVSLTEQANAADARLLITTPQRRVVVDSEGTLNNVQLPQPSAFNEMASEIQRARGSEQAFLADISHELRTPLTSIQGFAQAIVEGEARGDAVSHVAEIIHREARRLVRMVEGLLQVARLESGTQAIGREDVAPARLLESAVAALEVQAKDAGVTFDVAGAEALPSLRGDPDKLAQLFLNVLDNAVKHSPRGATVHVRGSRDDGDVIVRVRDAGSGFPEGAQARLFQRFYRGENALRNGAGLGLAIAQAIAQAHGGSITAANVDGGGAEFAVRLPLAT